MDALQVIHDHCKDNGIGQKESVELLSDFINYRQLQLELYHYLETPEWRRREREAEAVNRRPAVNGIWLWKCETCGVEWTSPEEKDYDRTQDTTNWPVQCDDCRRDTYE